LGAGGFYFLMAFTFHYFPLPIFFYVREQVLTYATKKHKKKGDLGSMIWSVGRFFMIMMLLVAWWGVFAIYAYTFYEMIQHYLPDAGADFWTYYAMGVALPAIWALVVFVRFFFIKKELEQVVMEDDDRPLLEQMAGTPQ
jgi:hypothetical protein